MSAAKQRYEWLKRAMLRMEGLPQHAVKNLLSDDVLHAASCLV